MGYREVKERQYEVIEKLVGGNDVCVSLPTACQLANCLSACQQNYVAFQSTLLRLVV